MNAVERVLYDELTQLLDRLAASIPEGGLATARAAHPQMAGRLDEAEARLAIARQSLLDGYAQWRRGLEDVENLWALAAWRSAAEDPAEQPASLAA